MNTTLPKYGSTEYVDLIAERNTIAAQLRLPNTFRTAQDRSKAAARLKELTSLLNRSYAVSRGL